PTLPEKVAEQLEMRLIEEFKLEPEHVSRVLAMGGKKTEFVMPTEIVEQLKATEKAKAIGPVAKMAEEAMATWKAYILNAPHRALGYWMRNLTGDTDPVLAAAPGLAKYVPQAMGELQEYYNGKLALSDDLRRSRDLGVIDSSLTAQEIPQVKDLVVFRRFVGSRGFRPVQGYSEFVRKFNSWREGTYRYAAYLYYRDQLRAGKVEHFGGAKPEVVTTLVREMGPDVAAANLARNLLGDYGNLTVFGDWMRRRMAPFWSWIEINTKRYPRLASNAVK